MDTKKERKIEIIIRIIRSLILCVALFCSAYILGKTGLDEFTFDSIDILFGIAVIMMSIFYFLNFIRMKNKQEKFATIQIFYILLYLVVAVFSFLTKISRIYFIVASTLYMVIPILKRIVSIILIHKKRNVIANVLLLIVNLFLFSLILLSFTLNDLQEYICAIIIGVQILITCLVNIALQSVSNFKLDLLKKIIRKTYAGEILFGLLLLIVAFSLTFSMLEPNINTFTDALWYCFAVVTTIGFGDIAASSILGRILTVFLGIYGIVVVAIITSIIVNFYNETKSDIDDEDVKQEPKNNSEINGDLNNNDNQNLD